MEFYTPYCTSCGHPMTVKNESYKYDIRTGEPIMHWVARCTKTFHEPLVWMPPLFTHGSWYWEERRYTTQ